MKTLGQFNKDLENKITGLRILLKTVNDYPLESEERFELSRSIASSLRAILFGDVSNRGLSLIERCNLDSKLLFPLYNSMECLNIYSSLNLLQYVISNSAITVKMNDDVRKEGVYWGAYLTFKSWLNEVVIDVKHATVEPISRLLLIKIVADTQGSHVDDNYDERLSNLSKIDVFPIVFVDDKQIKHNLDIKANSIFCETILSIAFELIHSYEVFAKSKIEVVGPSNIVCRIQKYECSNKKYNLFKYEIAIVGGSSKNYNANSYYKCSIFEKRLNRSHICQKGMRYESCVIDFESILDGTFLGTSIYKLQ